jgi:hypothetical protein
MGASRFCVFELSLTKKKNKKKTTMLKIVVLLSIVLAVRGSVCPTTTVDGVSYPSMPQLTSPTGYVATDDNIDPANEVNYYFNFCTGETGQPACADSDNPEYTVTVCQTVGLSFPSIRSVGVLQSQRIMSGTSDDPSNGLTFFYGNGRQGSCFEPRQTTIYVACDLTITSTIVDPRQQPREFPPGSCAYEIYMRSPYACRAGSGLPGSDQCEYVSVQQFDSAATDCSGVPNATVPIRSLFEGQCFELGPKLSIALACSDLLEGTGTVSVYRGGNATCGDGSFASSGNDTYALGECWQATPTTAARVMARKCDTTNYVFNADEYKSFAAQDCTYVKGLALLGAADDSADDLSALSPLIAADSLHVSGTNLKSLHGLSLAALTNELLVQDNTALTRIDALNSLAQGFADDEDDHMPRVVRITGNKALDDCLPTGCPLCDYARDHDDDDFDARAFARDDSDCTFARNGEFCDSEQCLRRN